NATAAYQAPLAVTFADSATGSVIMRATATTDQEGGFTVGGIPNGTYDVRVKASTTLSVLLPGLNFSLGSVLQQNFWVLLAGDANGDDTVNIADFSALRGGFGTATGCASLSSTPCGDFNG